MPTPERSLMRHYTERGYRTTDIEVGGFGLEGDREAGRKFGLFFCRHGDDSTFTSSSMSRGLTRNRHIDWFRPHFQVRAPMAQFYCPINGL